MLVRQAPPEHYSWLLSRLGCAATPDFRALEAVDEKDVIHGMVGCDYWTLNAVHMHVAVTSGVRGHCLIRPAFEWVFETARRGLALGLIRSDNPKALKLNLHLGFRETHRIREGAAAGVDLVLMEMRREECRWLKPLARQRAA